MPAATVETGGKAQLLVGVNGARRGLSVQNNSDGPLRIVQGGQDASGSNGVSIPAGGYYETPTNRYAGGSWSIWGATAGQSYGWEEW